VKMMEEAHDKGRVEDAAAERQPLGQVGHNSRDPAFG
jgi:hypothetical protein